MKASVPYFTFEKIGLQSFTLEPSSSEVKLRQDQIAMRHAEIEETFHVLSEIQAGRGYEIVQRSRRHLGTKLAGHAASPGNKRLPENSLLRNDRPLEDWEGKLDLEFPTLCGHSFGGATVIEMMRKENPFPIAIVLDPWVEPVRDPAKEEDQVKGAITKPIYVLNSESFTVWEEHFEKLKRICLDARKTSGRGWLLTLTGSKHTDFSDYPFLLPTMFRSTVGPSQTIEVFSKATYMQMGLSRQRVREKENTPGYKVDRQGSFSDNAPNSSGAGAGEAEQSLTSSGSNTNAQSEQPQVEHASPTKMVADDAELVAAPATDFESGLGQRGKGMPSETMVHPPDIEPNGERHEAVYANVNAKEEGERAATPATNFEHGSSTNAERDDSRLQASSKRADASGSAADCSCQQLHEESENDTAAAGQEARDMAGARLRQTGNTVNSDQIQQQQQQGQDQKRQQPQKDFITDVRYLKMIDADHDVLQVHEKLEGIADKFADKSKFRYSASVSSCPSHCSKILLKLRGGARTVQYLAVMLREADKSATWSTYARQ